MKHASISIVNCLSKLGYLNTGTTSIALFNFEKLIVAFSFNRKLYFLNKFVIGVAIAT